MIESAKLDFIYRAHITFRVLLIKERFSSMLFFTAVTYYVQFNFNLKLFLSTQTVLGLARSASSTLRVA